MRLIDARQMAKYWAMRVAELESMRPITASEAMINAHKTFEVKVSSRIYEWKRIG